MARCSWKARFREVFPNPAGAGAGTGMPVAIMIIKRGFRAFLEMRKEVSNAYYLTGRHGAQVRCGACRQRPGCPAARSPGCKLLLLRRGPQVGAVRLR